MRDCERMSFGKRAAILCATAVVLFAVAAVNCSCSSSDSSLSGQQTSSQKSESNTASSNTITDNTDGTEKKASSKEIQEIGLGETIECKDYSLTLNDVSLSYDVTPDNPPRYYHHYPADSGYVYVDVDADVYNSGKRDIDPDDVYSAKAYYGDGYTYNGFTVTVESDGDFSSYGDDIAQLETRGVHSLIKCPEIVEEDTESPLYVVITLSDKTQYKYVVR